MCYELFKISMVEWALEYDSDLRIVKSYAGLDPGAWSTVRDGKVLGKKKLCGRSLLFVSNKFIG